MKTKFIQILTFALIAVFQVALAQQVVTGSVTDQDGMPLPGATVVIKGTSSATTADFDGNYTIAAKNGDVLVISYVGYKKIEATVNGVTLDINLTDSNELENVEVIGYKSLSKIKSAASVSTIDATTIENRPNPSIIQTLQGQIAGVDINTTSGQPGANSLINIRGIGSINGNTEPLILLDGTPINEDEFQSFNPQEIEEIKVLKDAGATAIYGNRGANGVILITTKRGEYDKPLEINYNGYSAVSYFQKDDYNMMNASELLTLEKAQETGYGFTLTDEEISAVTNNDWRDVFFRAGKTQSHTISLSSGSTNTNQYTSIGFQDTEGIIITSSLKRFNLRNNFSGRSENGKFNYNSSLSLNYSTANSPGDLGSGSINWNIVFGTVQSVPYLNLSDYNYTDPQNFAANSAGNDNVLLITPLILYDLAQKYTALEEQQKIVYNFDTSYDISDNITFRSVTGLDYSRFEALNSNPPNAWTPTYFEVDDNAGQNASQTQTTTSVFSVNQVTSLTYDQTFGDHSVSVSGFLEYFKSHYKYYGYTANGGSLKTYYPGDGSFFIGDNSSNDFFVDSVGANMLNAGLFSYFGSLDYDFDDKYGFSAVYRKDASYRFAESNKWATFGSVAARWNIDKEDFMSDSIFDYLKLRVSYGTAGNQRINGGGYFTSPDLTKNLYSTSEGYKGLPSIQVAQFANNTLKWETIAQADIGIEFAINKWGLSGEIDYYHKKTSDLFQSKPVSAINAITRQSANIGTLYNKGVDLTLNYQMIKPVNKGDFGLDFRFVGNYNKNELQDLPSDTGYIIGIGRNGGMIGENYTIRYAGVNPANGNLLFYTKDGALTESPDADNDRVWLDNSNVPDFQGGFSISSSYKGFSLQAMFNYQIGITRYDGDYANVVNYPDLGSFNLSRDVLRAWTPENRITDMPSFDATNANSFSSNRFYKNGDFLGLRFASLSYTLPKEITNSVGFDDVTLYLNGENLFVLTEWRGYDPFSRNEVGLDYPSPKTFTLGLNLKF
jgi:TonB-linked SusC/RagA family outer membrane protein